MELLISITTLYEEYMKRIAWSFVAVLAVLVGFRLISPATEAAPTPAYHIVYLLDRGIRYENELVRPENLFKGMTNIQVDTVVSWKDLLKAHSKQPIDALVLHESAVSMVDFEWIANAYWHGLTISTISTRPAMLAHLFDDACLPFGYTLPVNLSEDGPYVTISLRLILSVQDQNQVGNWFRRDWHRNCAGHVPAEVNKPVSTLFGFASGPLETKDMLAGYQYVLFDFLETTREKRETFSKELKDSHSVIIQTLP
jgi:hypothetical protein